jgi:dipeptide/tripeptide permease
VLQAEQMDSRSLGVEWLSSQIQAVNPILILMFIPLFAWVIYPAIDRIFPLTPLRKIAIGFFLTVPAFAVPAWIESEITGGRVVRFKSEATAHPSDDARFESAEAPSLKRWAREAG